MPVREKADPGNPAHVAAPMTGVATVEAMKVESVVTAQRGGAVERLAVGSGTNVEPGDLLLAPT